MPYTYDPDDVGVVPEGVHVMTVASVDETESSKGDPMWIVRLVDKDGLEVPEFIVHKPNIIDWKFRPLWEASGLEWPSGRAVIDEHKLIDRQVQVTIKHERSEQFGLQPRVHGYEKVGVSDLNPTGQESFPEPEPVTVPDDDDEPIPF